MIMTCFRAPILARKNTYNDYGLDFSAQEQNINYDNNWFMDTNLSRCNSIVQNTDASDT